MGASDMTKEPEQEDRGAQETEEDYSWWGSKVKDLFLKNPTLVLSLLYLYVTAMGLLYSSFLYARFGINILDYSEISDFLLAALKNPIVLSWSLSMALLYLVYLAFQASHLQTRLKTRSHGDTRFYEPSVRSNNGGGAAETPAELRRREEPHVPTPEEKHHAFIDSHWHITVQAIVYAFFVVFSSLVLTYVFAIFLASSIKDGEKPAVEVRYRSFSGSTGQVTEPGLELIGATQKAVFFYDVDDQRTLVIPQSQLVSIEVPEQD
jgi:hypothetical protein